MMELLNVTDAAVKALDRSSRSLSSVSSGASGRSKVSESKEGSKTADSGFKTLTPLIETESPVTRKVDNENNNGLRSSDDSTTASDVLIRSTIADKDTSLIELNTSNTSKCSKSSLGGSSFNDTGSLKVKISGRLLREIPSPHEMKRSENMDISSKEWIPPALCNIHDSTPRMVSGNTRSHHVSAHQIQPRVDAVSRRKNTTNPDSTEEVAGNYYIERHTPQKKNKREHSSHDHFTESTDKVKPAHMVLNHSVDLIPQKEVASNSSSCSSQPEIITIPEKIVTITASTSLSDMSETENGPLPSSQPDTRQHQVRFQTYNKATGTLRQGAPVDGLEAVDRQRSLEDVHISKFGLTDRQRQIKQSFTKRYDQAGPVKRVVQPKFVGRMAKEVPPAEKKETGSDEQTGRQSNDVITAAVAASAAVAATQPFLRSQHELETKVAQILDRITTLPNTAPAEYSGSGPELGSYRIQQLEKQVSDLTDKRLDYLEKLQHQQFEMQAQLFSVSRTAPSVSHHYPDKSLSQQQEKPRQAISKTRLSDEIFQSHREKAEKPYENDKEKSPLDTPAPRTRAPKPVAYESSTDLHGKGKRKQSPTRSQKTGGFLEEILATAGSPLSRNHRDASYVIPKQQSATSLVNRPSVDESLHNVSSSTVRKASNLVKELSSLREEMKGLVSDAKVMKHDGSKIREDKKRWPSETVPGLSPLDAYLNCPSIEASPYKTVPDLSPRRFNAPLPPGFSEATKALKQVEMKRGFFEANLETVLRSQQDAEVYTLIENLYQDSTNVERNHIKHLVDKCISALKPEIQREVEAEEIVLDIKKALSPVRPQPQRVPIRGQTKGISGSRVDTGLRKTVKEPVPRVAEKKATIREKENPFLKPKPAAKKKVRPEDEDYMTKVYGKAAYQNKRTTVKDPYLHFQNVSRPKTARAPPPVEVKGTELKSAKTQTSAGVRQFYFSPQSGTYIPVVSGSTTAPIPGQLIPMAVPLRDPRMNSGMTVSVTRTMPAGVVTSTPSTKPQVTASNNVTLVSVPVREGIDHQRIPELGKQVLPAVDINGELSAPLSPVSDTSSVQREVYLKSPQMSPSKTKFEVMFHDEASSPKKHLEESRSVSEYSDDDAGPEEAVGLSLPGHQLPELPQQYNGPVFPPAFPVERPVIMSDTIADDLRRTDMLQNKAAEWIEQELMARIISEMYPLKPDQPANVSHLVSEYSEDSMADDRQESILVTDAIGRDGMQLFIDAGQPVDNSMVNKLIQEVLSEKISAMLAQAPEDQKEAETKTSQPAVIDSHDVYRSSQPPSKHVVTPQPTPKSSPVISPVRLHSPLATPTGSPRFQSPQKVSVFDYTQMTTQESEPDTSLSLDISEELKKVAAKLTKEEPVVTVEEKHEVATPIASPTPELVPAVQELTPPSLSPRVVKKPTLQLTQTLQEPEVEEEIQSGPSSPKPWGDSDSPLPEENPEYIERDIKLPEEKPKPFVMSVAPEDDMMGQSIDFTQSLPPQTPPKQVYREEPPSPELSESESISSASVVSDTVGLSVSEGQWLISRSEGQAPEFFIDEATRKQMFWTSRHHGNVSTASTLKDTDDMEDEEVYQSDGEFLHKSDFPPEKDPVLALIMKMKHQQHQPINFGQIDMTANQVQHVLDTTRKSMGEISLHGNHRLSVGEITQESITKSSGEITNVLDDDYRDSSPKKFTVSEASNKGVYSPLRISQLREQSLEQIPLPDESLEQIPLPEDPVHDESLEQIPLDDVSIPPLRTDMRNGSLMSASDVPVSMVTVTPGARTPQLRSSLQKPPQVLRSQSNPTKPQTTPQTRVVQVRSSEERKDSYGNTQGFDMNSTLSDRPLTMTPDQMNTDAFIQSGYLTQSLSQSEIGTRTLERPDQTGTQTLDRTDQDFHQLSPDQTVDQRRSIDSIEFRQLSLDRTAEQGRSLGLSYSFESEESSELSDLRRLAGSGTFKMSVTIPTIGQSDDESGNLSELEIPSENY